MLTHLLPSKQILTVPSLYGVWPVRGGCVISKQSSAELCYKVVHVYKKTTIPPKKDWGSSNLKDTSIYTSRSVFPSQNYQDKLKGPLWGWWQPKAGILAC